jgi:hypothetical protein
MLNDYVAALIAHWHSRGLARSALPDAPVRPDPKHRGTDQDDRPQVPPRGTDRVEPDGPSDSTGNARPGGSLVICPCGGWQSTSADDDAVLDLCRHLFPHLDEQLDAWERTHGWLYR